VTIPDGTIVSPGETFTKTWRVQNPVAVIGILSYMLSSIAVKTMGGKTTAVPYVVYSGNQMDISVSMTAPTDLEPM
jgi:hypothetical protein